MGKSQRRKGAVGERQLCAVLGEALGQPVHRVLGQARDGGGDILLPPFLVEAKRRARIAGLYDWMAQAEKAAAAGQFTPMVFCRADGKDWLVVLQLQDAVRLMRREMP